MRETAEVSSGEANAPADPNQALLAGK